MFLIMLVIWATWNIWYSLYQGKHKSLKTSLHNIWTEKQGGL